MRTSVDVHNRLQDLEIKHELVALSGSVKNSARMADLLGLELCCVIKTLVWLADDVPVLAIIPGDRRVDPRKLKKVTRADGVRFATDDEVTAITGYLVGATPPVGWKTGATVCVDPSALKNDIVYATGGEPNIILKMRSADLAAATGGTIADIAE